MINLVFNGHFVSPQRLPGSRRMSVFNELSAHLPPDRQVSFWDVNILQLKCSFTESTFARDAAIVDRCCTAKSIQPIDR